MQRHFSVPTIENQNKMETLKFKSTIKCAGCIATVTPQLNSAKGVDHWEVDLNSPEKILTVTGSGITATQIKEALEPVGYAVEPLE